MNGAGIIGLFPGSVEMMHDDLMLSAVIDHQDKVVGDGGPVQNESRTTLRNGSRLFGRCIDMGFDADMIGGLAISNLKFDV